jgi:thymidylate kinase
MTHPLLHSVFNAFHAEGVRWALLRLPLVLGAANGGDVDLLLASGDVRRVQKILQNFGFVNITPYSGSVHMYFVTYDRPTDSWLCLDLVSELSFGRHNSLKTRAEEKCLATCQYHGVVRTLAPDDDFWILLSHCILDKGFIAGRHRARLQELLPAVRTDGLIAQALEGLSLTGWSLDRMLECVSAGDWTALESIAPALTASAIRRHVIAPWQMAILRLSRLKDRLLNLRRCRGLSVALLGPDGAGKTTLMVDIQESFMLPVRSVYMGLTGGLLRYIAMLHVPGIVFLGRLLVFWGRYLLAQYHQARGRHVVFDRYIYDAMVPHPERLNWLRRASRWMDGHACPGPDLVLVLDAPGEVMYARKGEYTAETLEEWRHYFLALKKRFPQVEVIDTTRDRDAVRIEVIDRIWQRYVSRRTNNAANANQPLKPSGVSTTFP